MASVKSRGKRNGTYIEPRTAPKKTKSAEDMSFESQKESLLSKSEKTKKTTTADENGKRRYSYI